jgi:hypothetical protein
VQSYVLINVGVVSVGLTTFSVPAITQSIVDQGSVMVYVRNTGTTLGWYPLPYSESGNTISLSDFVVGAIDLKANFTQTNAFDFRIVVISGTGLTQINVANPHLNFNNYSEVAAALHLPK